MIRTHIYLLNRTLGEGVTRCCTTQNCGKWADAFASRLAPTLECISTVGASLLAKGHQPQ
ncbi:hypothetical protein E5170_15745 [Pseudomonas atacamensis]|uniref:Uncharacterized protein n=1 Tax=Pseudomonas atacamensis TaxID=2565368 RepID=A0AAQ2DB03_9PSED|nr:hypothetical protein E5170_15745 [Pseudomonas atacamensis]